MRLITSMLAIAATLATSPATARDHWHHGSGNGTAVAAGIAGVAVGALGATIIAHRERAATNGYGYRNGYNGGYGYTPSYTPSYQPYQPAYQPGYQQPYQPAYQGYSNTRPAPNGVRCLVWNGRGYVPMDC